MFTQQKNVNNGRLIAHAPSGDPRCCPVLAATHQISFIARRSTTSTGGLRDPTKLVSYFPPGGKNITFTADAFTTIIRNHATMLRTTTGTPPSELSACSLRAGGAMVLLTGGCDGDITKLLGC